MPFPTRTETFDNFYTSAFNNRHDEVMEQVFKEQPAYDRLRRMGRIKLSGYGGRFIEFPLAYAKNETVISVGRGDSISLADTQFLTVAQYQWKYLVGNIVRYFTDDQEIKDQQRAIDLANAKIDNLRESITDKLEEMLAGDGSGNGNKDFEGFANLIDATPDTARTVGNIAQTTFTWWKNKQLTATGAAQVYLVSDLRTLFNNCSRGQKSRAPTVGFTTQVIHELLEDEVGEKRLILQKDQADPDMELVTLRGRPVLWNDKITSGRFYWVNENYLTLLIDPDVDLRLTEWKVIPNSLDRAAQAILKGNLVSNRRVSQGVCTGIA